MPIVLTFRPLVADPGDLAERSLRELGDDAQPNGCFVRFIVTFRPLVADRRGHALVDIRSTRRASAG